MARVCFSDGQGPTQYHLALADIRSHWHTGQGVSEMRVLLEIACIRYGEQEDTKMVTLIYSMPSFTAAAAAS